MNSFGDIFLGGRVLASRRVPRDYRPRLLTHGMTRYEFTQFGPFKDKNGALTASRIGE